MREFLTHELCEIFPVIEGEEFYKLVDDIKVNGLLQPITLYHNKILDGRNRYRACVKAGVEPKYITYDGNNPVAFVLSANLHRRHLKPSQTAVIVSKAQDWATAHSHGGDRKSIGAKKSNTINSTWSENDNEKSSTINSTWSDEIKTESIKDRANAAGVSKSTQQKADAVVKASPELANKVISGEISLNEATEQVAPQLINKKSQEYEVISKDELENLKDTLSETISVNEQILKKNTQLESIINSDDKLAEANKEIEKLTTANESYKRLIAQQDVRIAELTIHAKNVTAVLKKKDEEIKKLKALLESYSV
ncbi:ParB N-terminal domain-containing protein [Taylorella asinigenitalis]|uniref:Transcriptional activator adenine-specific DNA methyltransferase-like protein n=1 Tax=Taylorella asinigenitalis (strain MCE3) TaxID=1008459 RepID=G4QCS5_TAYAM|nr:ParB N-terminal domain-containing protein [Taylorella asinigenitalis]AEP36205.1 Transcriptional activator adenine-specific DNA methyltransferase-like protein [Taylorella asinigenitalis MCE3]